MSGASNRGSEPFPDRFVCRREGHLAQVKVTKTTLSGKIITSCKRCGKVIEVEFSPDA